jgi:hypothetical protein
VRCDVGGAGLVIKDGDIGVGDKPLTMRVTSPGLILATLCYRIRHGTALAVALSRYALSDHSCSID